MLVGEQRVSNITLLPFTELIIVAISRHILPTPWPDALELDFDLHLFTIPSLFSGYQVYGFSLKLKSIHF